MSTSRGRGWPALFLLVLACCVAAAATPPRHQTTRRPAHNRSARESRISNARARQIQIALERAGYIHHVSGHWDATTREAMKRFQENHHWQTRFVPDSRALIALGLGPKYDQPAAIAASARGAGGSH
ncbi:MAG: peptidoglycan-binding domain-containing protein [Terriglobales bacterium]